MNERATDDCIAMINLCFLFNLYMVINTSFAKIYCDILTNK